MATDFTNNNTTVNTSGGLKPNTRNAPLDMRTRVNLKADIDSIPNPFVGMHIIVLQDETNDNQMTEYVVTSLKANNLGVADSKINEVVLAKDFLGVSSTNGSGMTSEQVQQLNAAYTHSQSAHVQQSDLPTKTSQLTNDSGFITEHQDISGKADKSEIPTKTSQLTNDSNFISSIPSEYVTETKLNEKGYLTEIPSEYITESELNAKGYLTEHQDISGKADKSEIPTKTSQLENDSNFATESFVSNKIAEAQLQQGEVDLSGYQTKEDDTLETTNKTIVGAINEVNTNIMSKVNKSDIPTKTSQLTNDSNFLTSVPSEYVTETELESKGYLTEHQSLEDYALKTELPTKTSQLTNDSGYLTEHQNISGKADKSYVDTELAKKSDKTHAHSYNDLSDKPAIPSVDGLATKKELTDGLATKSDTGHTHDQYLTEHQDLSDYALKSEIPTVPTKTSQLTNDSNFISSIPEEYVTEQELNSKGLATETFVTNKIAEASLSGGEVDLSGYATKDELNSTIQDYTGGKKQIYLTQAEYDILSIDEKNDSSKVYNITDVAEQEIPTKTSQLQNDSGFITSIPSEYITETELNEKGYLTEHQDISGKANKSEIPTDLMINDSNLLQLKDANGNAIGTGVTVSTTSGGSNSYTLPIASNTVLGGIKVGSNLSIDNNGVLSATVTGTGSGMTDNEVDTVLTNVFGESYLPQVYGNIIVSVNQLSIKEGKNDTFTVSLSQVPTRPQTITIISNNPDVTVNPSSIDISDTNAHTITVIAAEDDDFDNDSAILTLSSPNVQNVTVNVTVIDNDVRDEPPMGTNIVNVEASQWVADNEKTIRTILPIKVTPKATYTISKQEGIGVIVYASTADGAFGNTIASDNTSSFTFVPATDYVIISMWNLVSDSWGGDIKNAPSMCGLTVIKTTEA